MKRIIVLAFLFAVSFCISSQEVESTPIPKTVQFLFVNPCLKGGMIISNENFKSSLKDTIVRDDGRTMVRLVVGSVYIVKINDKYYYPNGEPCVYGSNGRAAYFGDRKWLHSAYSSGSNAPIEQYFVTWPLD